MLQLTSETHVLMKHMKHVAMNFIQNSKNSHDKRKLEYLKMIKHTEAMLMAKEMKAIEK